MDLECREGGSDKTYHIWIENVGANHFVKYMHGRRGSVMKEKTHCGPVSPKEAQEVFDKIVKQKLAGKRGRSIYKLMTPLGSSPKPAIIVDPPGIGALGAAALGFTVMGTVPPDPTPTIPITLSPVAHAGIAGPQLLNPIGDEEVDRYLKDDDFVLQEKHDGERWMLGQLNGEIIAIIRRGNVEAPPEFCSALQKAFPGVDFILDGEICGSVYWAFDCLLLETIRCVNQPYEERLINLGMLMRSTPNHEVLRMVATHSGKLEKTMAFKSIKETGGEGVVFKNLNATHCAGRPASGGDWLKYKFYETCICRIAEGRPGKRSMGIELVENHRPIFMGNVTIPNNQEIPAIGDRAKIRYLYANRGGHLQQTNYIGKVDQLGFDDIKTIKYKRE